MRDPKSPYVYILASKRNGTLYTGVTSDLGQRISQHKQDLISGFTSRYGVHTLVYAKFHDTMEQATSARRRSRDGGELGKSS